MNLGELSTSLEKIYNTVGNRYLTSNFITEPFEFKVKVIYDRDNDMYDYIIQVYSIPDIPDSFKYRPEVKESKRVDGIHISVLKSKFKEYIQYIDPNTNRYYGIEFMNLEKR